MDIYAKIKQLREDRGMSQEALAQQTGYTDRSSIAKVEKGLVSLSADKITLFAKALGTTPGWLTGWSEDLPENVISLPGAYRVPLVGTIACGKPVLAVEEADETVSVPDFVRADFALRCKGDSMINARIFDGDVVYIRAQSQVENGQIAAVRVGDEATLKRVYYIPENQRVILRACNPMYADLDYSGDELEQIEVLGLAVGFFSTIHPVQE